MSGQSSTGIIPFTKQAWHTFSFILRVLVFCLLKPLQAFYMLPRANRPNPSWSLVRCLTWKFTKEIVWILIKFEPPFFIPNHLALLRGGVWIEPTPQLIVGELKEWAESAGVQCVRIPGYWLKKDNAGTSPAYRKVLYSLHAGAYVAQSGHPSDLTCGLPRSIMQDAHAISRILRLEYRLTRHPKAESPNPFPAALLDAIAGYNYLVRHENVPPSDIIIVGDSAGGNLTLALVRYLIENRGHGDVDLPPPPGALVLCSPWCDMSGSDIKDGGSPLVNKDLDVLETASPTILRPIDNFLGPHGCEAAESNPYISPAAQTSEMKSISFQGFPRTFITAGGFETMRDQIRVLAKRMARDLGKNVKYYEMEEAIHDLLIFPWYYKPDKVDLSRTIAAWIDSELEEMLI